VARGKAVGIILKGETMSFDLDYEIIVMCAENNIRRGSRNVKDYERGKTLINELFPDRYEEAIVELAEFIGV
jgi:hypothetical protein